MSAAEVGDPRRGAGISTSLLRETRLASTAAGFLVWTSCKQSEREKFQINYGWTSKREMVIAHAALIAIISVGLAMAIFLLWGVVTNF
jgi:hypothetical protein